MSATSLRLPGTRARVAAGREPQAPLTGAALYDRAARHAASCVVEDYSTSFAHACRLLAEPVRTHVRCVYALVRVADEVVDAPDLALGTADRARLLDELERDVLRGLAGAPSTNLVVHAFALTARACGIGTELVTPFFASMRTDLHRATHDDASLVEYVYGSAEVVGLMCLRVFVADLPPERRDAAWDELVAPARRLGAAFQKVNFLRDLAADHDLLGRTYLPDAGPAQLTTDRRDALVAEIDSDLAAAATGIELLPASSRLAVRTAHGLFAALTRRLAATPPDELARRRVRVGAGGKAATALRAVAVETRRHGLPVRVARRGRP